MIISINRLFSTSDETIGVLSINRKPFCFTLEDEYRETKVVHETRIPAGEYRLGLRQVGNFAAKYRGRFAPWHTLGMVEIRGVPGFTNILFHCGNTDEDTSGCILLGDGADLNGLAPGMMITKSSSAYGRFYHEVAAEIYNGHDVRLFITDGDR